MGNRRVQGFIMALVGFAILLGIALDYLLKWDIFAPAFAVLGLVFVLIGLRRARDGKPM